MLKVMDRCGHLRRYLPPNVIEDNKFIFLPELKYVGVTFILLPAIDVSDDDLSRITNTPSRTGHRVRTVISSKATETCAQISKKLVMKNISFLENIWNNSNSNEKNNVNLVLNYGDGSSSTVYVRYNEGHSHDFSVLKMELSICLKMLVDETSCALAPNGRCFKLVSNVNIFFSLPQRRNKILESQHFSILSLHL